MIQTRRLGLSAPNVGRVFVLNHPPAAAALGLDFFAAVSSAAAAASTMNCGTRQKGR